MSLENWAKNRWLEKLDPDAKEIDGLVAVPDGHLADLQQSRRR